MVKVGMVGCGGITSAHLRGWLKVAETGQGKVVAAADITRDKAEALSGNVGGADVFTDYHEMLKRADIEAVDITLPHNLHRDAIVAAAEAGKHIICEKPLCLNLKEADDIKRVVEKSGVVMMCAHNNLFTPSVQAAKKLMLDGMLGNLFLARTIDIFLSSSYPPGPVTRETKKVRPEMKGWRAKRENMGGGELIDTGYHPTYTLLYLVDSKPVEVTAMTGKYRLMNMDGEDTAQVLVKFENGAIGNILTGWSSEFPFGSYIFHLTGERGQLFGSRSAIYYKPPLLEPASRELEPADTFTAEIEHFVDCIVNNREPIQTHADGTAVLKVILAAYEAVAEGVTVRIE